MSAISFTKLVLSFSTMLLSGMMNASCQNNNVKKQTEKKMSAGNFKEGKDYELFERARVTDKNGFDVPAEAYSMLLPKGWTYNGEITWRAPGTGCDGTYSQFKAQSADGKYSLEILPPMLWSWTSNEAMRQFQQPIANCYYGDPMDAAQYLKTVFIPKELNNAKLVSMEPNQAVATELSQNNAKARAELMKYGASEVNIQQSAVNANVQWTDNTEGLILCAVSVSELIVPNVYNGTYDRNITCQAAKRIVFKYPAGKKEEAMKQLSVILGSVTTNPGWQTAVNDFWKNVRERRQIAHIGKIKMMDAQTRAIGERAIQNGNNRLAAMDNEHRAWEAKQSTDDRIHSNFIKTIREVETYRDASGKVELNSGYNHAWSRGDGNSFIMTNSPNFDPSSVLQDQSWKEMKKID
ncbi:MAG: hypothetical protein EOP51_23335 [Sphingobacteriales bacterium]|nr:MAG: hypothetical protein EOP51_23335 [Sphingobacteriales bacterium]